MCEYDGLFIVLNKDGKVLSWQLTKGTSFAHIQDLLQDIIQRHHQDQCSKSPFYQFYNYGSPAELFMFIFVIEGTNGFTTANSSSV